MNFNKALEILNIKDYKEAILKSNSRGELFHLQDYITIAEEFDHKDKWFRSYFLAIVQYAKDNHKRPQSIYQHVLEILIDHVNNILSNGKR